MVATPERAASVAFRWAIAPAPTIPIFSGCISAPDEQNSRVVVAAPGEHFVDRVALLRLGAPRDEIRDLEPAGSEELEEQPPLFPVRESSRAHVLAGHGADVRADNRQPPLLRRGVQIEVPAEPARAP